MRKALTTLPLLLAGLPLPAFAEDSNPFFGVFGKVIVFAANNWLILTVLIPAFIMILFAFLAYGFARERSFGATVGAIFLGVVLSVITGAIMVKTEKPVKEFAKKASNLSTEVIDLGGD